MSVSFVFSAALFACLSCISFAQSPARTTAPVSLPSSCPSPTTGPQQQQDGDAWTGMPGSITERSFFAIKPDGLQRGLVGEVMSRFERKGWKLVGLKMLTPGRQLVERHYEEHADKDFFEKLLDYMCSGPVVAMVWEGHNVIAGGRKLLGATNPLEAGAGTIRGDLCTNAGRNLVHASDGPESARREIELWFSREETVQWSRATDPWISKNL
ncbi:unnamed protein product [Ectocarpus sp. CCAP 1310/34]|nr:unnamed protein product [Ectocarpus sp. CCAP 1310/34]